MSRRLFGQDSDEDVEGRASSNSLGCGSSGDVYTDNYIKGDKPSDEVSFDRYHHRHVPSSHSDNNDVQLSHRGASGNASELGSRSKQEDCIVASDDSQIWGVFDGHRGHEASSFASNFFVDHLESPSLVSGSSPSPQGSHDHGCRLVNCLRHLEASMQANQIGKRCGTTACVAKLSAAGHLCIANLGDSRAILIGCDGSVLFSTDDHKPDSVREKQRLLNNETPGATSYSVVSGRIDGELNVSRGLGDFDIKCSNPGLINIADVYESPVHAGDVLVIATDGLWDVFAPEEVAKVVLPVIQQANDPASTPRPPAFFAAQELTRQAVRERGSRDNCTAVVVVFK